MKNKVPSVASVLSLDAENCSSSSGISQNIDFNSSLIDYLKSDYLRMEEQKKNDSILLSDEKIEDLKTLATKQMDDLDIGLEVEKMKSLSCKWKQF